MPGELIGGAEFRQACDAFPRRLADELVGWERTTAEAVLSASRPPRKSGTLDRSQRVDQLSDGHHVVATAPYAGVIRFGWPRRNIRANDWLSPAVAKVRNEAEAAAGEAVEQTLRETF